MTPEPQLFVLWYDFSKWLLDKTEKFPKKVRFSFSNRIDNLALDIIEGIIEARYSRNKKDILRRIDRHDITVKRGAAADSLQNHLRHCTVDIGFAACGDCDIIQQRHGTASRTSFVFKYLRPTANSIAINVLICRHITENNISPTKAGSDANPAASTACFRNFHSPWTKTSRSPAPDYLLKISEGIPLKHAECNRS